MTPNQIFFGPKPFRKTKSQVTWKKCPHLSLTVCIVDVYEILFYAMVIKKNLPNICRTPITNHGERSRGNGLDDLREILGFFFGTRTSPTGNGASSDGWHTPPWNPRFRGPTCIDGRWFSQSQFAFYDEHNIRRTTNYSM